MSSSSKAYVAGYDLGTRTAAAFARDYPENVERVAFIEFALPSFGYEQNMVPTKDWAWFETGLHAKPGWRCRDG